MATNSAPASLPYSQPPGSSNPYPGTSGRGIPSVALGQLVRLRHLKAPDLPEHPEIAPLQKAAGTPPDLKRFVADVLEEAEGFMTGYLPDTFRVKSEAKSSSPATATVELLSHEISALAITKDTREPGTDARSETWFARESIHENAAKEGTASWEEFDRGLRADHSQHEMEYTPDVRDAHMVLTWDDGLESFGRQVGAWSDVQMSIVEMVHTIPPPLNDRVFPELIITAKKAEELVVVQIPVNTRGMPGTAYNTNLFRKLQDGMYVSIERAQLLDDGAKVKWQMATASDAKGILPMWAQKMGVPGAVIKDVGLFIGWTAKRRHGS